MSPEHAQSLAHEGSGSPPPHDQTGSQSKDTPSHPTFRRQRASRACEVSFFLYATSGTEAHRGEAAVDHGRGPRAEASRGSDRCFFALGLIDPLRRPDMPCAQGPLRCRSAGYTLYQVSCRPRAIDEGLVLLTDATVVPPSRSSAASPYRSGRSPRPRSREIRTASVAMSKNGRLVPTRALPRSAAGRPRSTTRPRARRRPRSRKPRLGSKSWTTRPT